MKRVRSADKGDMVVRFRRDMARLLEAVDRVSPVFRRRPISGDWKVKDVLAHVAAWDREASAAHSALLKRLRNLPPRLWQRPSAHRWRGGRPITVASLFAYTYRGETHYAGHAAEIEAAGRGGPA